MIWHQGIDEHHWNASFAPFHIRILPDVAASTSEHICYEGTITDSSLNTLWQSYELSDLTTAQRETLDALAVIVKQIGEQVARAQVALK